MSLLSGNPRLRSSAETGSVVVGVEVGPKIIRAGVCDRHLHLLGKTKITTRLERGPAAVSERIAKCIRYAVDECDLQMSQVERIGIAVPGRLRNDAVVEFCPEIRWENVPLQSAIAAQFDVPVVVGQLYELATLGIFTLEFNPPPGSLAAIFVAPQIGGAIRIDGGWQDLAPLQSAVENAEALTRMILATRPHPLFDQFRARDFRKALKKTESTAIRDYVTELATAAGECAALLHRQFSPEVIALAGGLMDELKEEILTQAQATLNRILSPSSGSVPTLVASKLGDLAAVAGAAVWARKQPLPAPTALIETA